MFVFSQKSNIKKKLFFSQTRSNTDVKIPNIPIKHPLKP